MKNKYMEEILNNPNYLYYAHTKKDSNAKELLSSHLKLTYSYYKKMEQNKSLDKKVKEIIKAIFHTRSEVTQRVYEMFQSAIYYHDIGKVNPLFQKNKMENDIRVEVENEDDTHAAFSARIYIDCMQKEILEDIKNFTSQEKVILLYITYYFAYIISRHHTNLEGIANLQDAIKSKNIPGILDNKNNVYEAQLSRLDEFIERIKPDGIGLYILCKLLYSCLITSDFYATYEYMTGNTVKVEIKDPYLFKDYENSILIKNIRDYQEQKLKIEGINKIRSDIFLETEKNLLDNMQNDIYYIEAPTGAGKTNMAINIARLLYQGNRDIKSIQYIFPFNTIIEQTSSTFDNYFEKYKDYMVINSISAMVKDINENLDYEKAYIKNAFRQYPIVMTSHVNFFDTLFGTGKEANYSLYHLVDSVVVIDEIQAYSNHIWRQMIEMFSKYSNLLNIKFVIMSATLPRLDKLLKTSITRFYPLIEDTTKYYQNDLFKNRVQLNFELLDKKITIEDLAKKILQEEGKKVLVECIKKETADKLYKQLKELAKNVYELTGDDNKYVRNEIIKIAKTQAPMILVSTQAIEAGVDIDMDVGFKDISFIDSEEQFIGRINRSAKKKNCIAYFFHLDDAKSIYRGDNRLEYTLEREEVKQWLKNKQFDKFYEKVMEKIYDKTERYNSENMENFYHYCSFINFKKIQKVMKLIDNNTIQLFLNYSLNIGDRTIIGKKVFQKYKEIYQDRQLGYAEKKIKLSKISEELNLFIYAIYKNKSNVIEGEMFGDLYYVEEGEKYIENGRFSREKYLKEGDGLFL